MLSVSVTTINIKQTVRGEGFLPIQIDAEERRWGSGKGLETLVPPTVNDEWWLLV